MKTSTRQRLLDSANRRFYRDGFRLVGLDQILSDVGISKTAFYKHFESKEDLILAGLEDRRQWMQHTFQSMIEERGGAEPLKRLHAVMDVVEAFMESEDFHGCIFVNASMEFPLLHEPIHRLAFASKQVIEDMVCELGREAGAPDPRAFAAELCLILEGAYVTRQVSGNPATIHIARRLADLVIDRHCPTESYVADSQTAIPQV